MYNQGSVIVCSQKLACTAVSLGFLSIIVIAVIIAFTKPGCPEATYTGEPLDIYGSSRRDKSGSIYLATNGHKFPWHDVRLPRFVYPLYYKIYLHPNATTNILKGNVKIAISAHEETDFIVLHSKRLSISNYTLQDKYLERIDIEKFLVYPHNQQIYLGLSRILHRGSNYTLSFIYETSINEGHDGIFRSFYEDEKGNRRQLLYTHFEPTGARSTFPCFDEPHLKGRFQLSVVRESDEFTLNNVPLRQSKRVHEPHLMLDEFEETVEMSSYLLSFVICDFANVTAATKNGVRISVYSPTKMVRQSSYALKLSTQVLEYFEDLLEVPYPLPKLDLIAIRNFPMGEAMENWGLITFSERALLCDLQETSDAAQMKVANAIVHELSHQWVSNLVSVTRWKDLWLSEGFANYLGNIGVAFAYPEWAVSDMYIIDKVQPALALDALLTSHPISIALRDATDVGSFFDEVLYNKGSSLIGMMEMYVGKDVVNSGLKNFLTKHRFSSAGAEDLWQSLTISENEEGSYLDVNEMMLSWTLQAGYPLVTIEMNGNEILVNQSRFVSNLEDIEDPNSPLNSTLGYMWYIPLTYISSDDPENSSLVWMNLTSVMIDVPNDLSWIKFNVGQRGFYRVNYDGQGWDMLTTLLQKNHLAIPAADRASIIDDAFTLARSGLIEIEIPLIMSTYLRNETAYAPWNTALSHLFNIAYFLNGHPSYEQMMAFIHGLILPQYSRLGWEDKGSHADKLLRSKILMVAVDCKRPEAIEKAQSLFSSWKTKNTVIPPNLRRVVYVTAIRYGMKDDWVHCNEAYETSSSPGDKDLLLSALAQTTDPWILQQFLEKRFVDLHLNTHDLLNALKEVSRNPVGQVVAWRLVRRYWSAISSAFVRDAFGLDAIITSATSMLYTDFDLKEIENFLSEIGNDPGKQALSQTVETIRLNMEWRSANLDIVANWLANEVNG